MAICKGDLDEHCCWLDGEQCRYLQENVNGRKWACSLLLKYSSWSEVNVSSEYLTDVKPKLQKIFNDDTNCGEWPRAGESCAICGIIG